MAVKGNLTPGKFPELSWEENATAESLRKLQDYAEQKAQDTIGWYCTKMRWRGLACRLFRVGAILSTAFAGALPILNQIASSGKASPIYIPEMDAMWASAAIALAATLVLLDRFYGFTTSWLRFVQTAQLIGNALDSFRMEAERLRMAWKDSEPDEDEAAAMLDTIYGFVARTGQIVSEETAKWAAEFAEVIKEIDEQVRKAAEAARRGGLQLTVNNGDKCTDNWTVTIDNGGTHKRRGKTSSFLLPGGMHTLTVHGTIKGREVSAEQTFSITGDAITEVTITLA